MITAAEINGMYGIIPTPALPGAERLDARDTVDVDETARVVDRLIRDGVSGIIALGTTGECPALSEDDFDVVTDTVVEAVAGRVPVFVGATGAGGHGTARRLRKVAASGATGALLGLPMWQPLTTAMAVEYYAQASAAFPDLALMVYANARAFRYTFPVEFWQGVSSQAPTVTSAKVSRAPQLERMLEVTGKKVNFIPSDMVVHDFAARAPQTTTACWATAAGMGPEPSIALMDALRRGDSEAAGRAVAGIAWANEPLAHLFADQEIFASYNTQIEKSRIAAAGYCRPGPVRSPYHHLPEEYAAASAVCGQRWRELRERIAAGTNDQK
ncbi:MULTISPECIES: dihydrodipicolinate synthase family protein [Streptomyces]|uniref:dihydrodipicolinate synthase family protein n=1 Tax=Streptomyces TaxID=1883 RepID=UPI00085CCCC7|nr:dihydrodipicolinate synthase family protein [Streptomyces sp. F-1]SFY52690.1 Trans-O-hydroxybenzylidenepyruvate hydratase-aldolase [Streptomyces sp. F-1]